MGDVSRMAVNGQKRSKLKVWNVIGMCVPHLLY